MKQENDKQNKNEKVENFIAGEKAKTEKTILALDLGTTTGWAISNEFSITSGSVSFKQDRFAGSGIRYFHFQLWLNQLPKVDVVYFEEVRRRLGVSAAHAYGGFLSNLTLWCEMHQIPYQGIPFGMINKLITDKDNANKLEMIEVIKALDYNQFDENEAYALGLLHLAVQRKNQLKKIVNRYDRREKNARK